jgi:K+-sensing histidine kinase KdpD
MIKRRVARPLPHRLRELAGVPGARLVLAVLVVAVATPGALLAGWLVGPDAAFAVFVLAVVCAGWSGGLAPALIATVLSAVSLDLLVVAPRMHFEPLAESHLVRVVTFLLVSVAIGALYERERASRSRTEALLEERTHTVEDLRVVADELRAANAAKDEFLGLVSHELKTPLTTIVLDAGLLERRADQIDADSRRLMVSEIGEESQRLSRIIDNLLTLARGDIVTSEPVLLGPLVKRVIARHQLQHPDRAVSLEVAPGVIASAQPLQFEQVLLNLLSNAEKYSAPDAPIDVSVSRRRGVAEISVLDRGAGIAPEDAERVFEPFYRSQVTADRAPGIGVGLAVCRRLVQAQEGEIWATPGAGSGTCFTFTLPLAEEADPVHAG